MTKEELLKENNSLREVIDRYNEWLENAVIHYSLLELDDSYSTERKLNVYIILATYQRSLLTLKKKMIKYNYRKESK